MSNVFQPSIHCFEYTSTTKARLPAFTHRDYLSCSSTCPQEQILTWKRVVPAGFNGLYGLRPSTGRLPYEGMANSMDGQNTVLSVVGPLSHSAGALRLIVQAILSRQPWLHDPLVHEIPWRQEQEKAVIDLVNSTKTGSGRLAFGILSNDRTVTPHPPVRRAVEIVRQTVERFGHKVCCHTQTSKSQY